MENVSPDEKRIDGKCFPFIRYCIREEWYFAGDSKCMECKTGVHDRLRVSGTTLLKTAAKTGWMDEAAFTGLDSDLTSLLIKGLGLHNFKGMIRFFCENNHLPVPRVLQEEREETHPFVYGLNLLFQRIEHKLH